MPKGRHLKPEFFTDKHVVSVSPLARLLFQGLWCYAADCGHLDDEPMEFKLRILPADNCDVEELLAELVEQGRIARSGGVIFIPTLARHGRIDKRYETACEDCKARRDHDGGQGSGALDHAVTTTGPQRDHGVTTRAGTPNHDADGDGDGDGDGDNSRAPQPPPVSASADAEREFDEWYLAYPRKRDKGHAAKAYRAARRKAPAQVLLDAVRAQTPALMAKGPEFCPYPATWLRGERWADEQPRGLSVVAADPDDPADLPPVQQTWMRRRPQGAPQ